MIPINVVVQNVSLVEGMAGSMRVRNILEPLLESEEIYLSNLALVHTYEKENIGNTGSTSNGIVYKYIGYKSVSNLSEIYTFYRDGIKFLRERYKPNSSNILYNYGYPDVKNFLLIKVAKKMGYKVIFDIVEDNRFDNKYTNFLAWIRRQSSVLLIKKIPYFANGIIVISKHLENRLLAICENQVPVSHIPITVNLKYFNASPWNPEGGNMKIFYGGSFYLNKDGMEYLITAFKNVLKIYPNLSLYLSGKSSVKEEMDKILNMIADCPQIKYLGFLEVSDYFRTLNECDVFCMPRNNTEMAHAGFPFKLGEFLAAGKAVIATNVGDVSLYLTNHVNSLIIEPESSQAIEDALEFCINNTEKLKEMGKEARITAEKHFSSTLLSRRTLDMLKSI